VKLVLAVLVVALAIPQRAEAACADEADKLRAFLVKEAARMDKWDVYWGMAFAGVSASQTALAVTRFKPFGTFDADYRDTLWVGAAKSFLGFGAHTVTAVRVRMPPSREDRCAELTALRRTLEKLGRDQRKTFFMTHFGGLAVNLTGAAILWHRRSFGVALTSVLISLPVGVATAYTMPRRAWHKWRDESPTWTVGVVAGEGSLLLSVGDEF
jgi:hypothetical protein